MSSLLRQNERLHFTQRSINCQGWLKNVGDFLGKSVLTQIAISELYDAYQTWRNSHTEDHELGTALTNKEVLRILEVLDMQKLTKSKEACLVVQFFRLFDEWSISADFDTYAAHAQKIETSSHRLDHSSNGQAVIKRVDTAPKTSKSSSPLIIETERFRGNHAFTDAVKRYVLDSMTLPHWLKNINLDALTRANLANLVFVFISLNNTDRLNADDLNGAAITFLTNCDDLPPATKAKSYHALKHLHHFCNVVMGVESELGCSFKPQFQTRASSLIPSGSGQLTLPNRPAISTKVYDEGAVLSGTITHEAALSNAQIRFG